MQLKYGLLVEFRDRPLTTSLTLRKFQGELGTSKLLHQNAGCRIKRNLSQGQFLWFRHGFTR